MYQKIMVPLDGSPLAETAIEPAADIARRRDGQIFFVRAYEPAIIPPAALGFVDRDELAKSEREALELYLNKQVIEGIPCHRAVVEGAGADPLLRFAEENDIELIVMTSHGHTGFDRWLFGSVAEKMVRHASCPVLTIGPKTLKKFAQKLGVKSVGENS